ncbi:MAG TPA: F0F1 ATP synthase subunit B [Gemmataceae bacterium]|nr:F0F1 ATP synthase subunit B [Gemmataceae bacterium]
MHNGRLLLCTLIAIGTLTFLSAGPASAAADHGEGTAAKGHDDHKKGAAEPPIFTPVRIDLAIWTLVVFLLLLFILTKYAWGPMLEALKKREESVRAAIEEALRAREEAQRLREQLQKELNSAHEKVREILDEGRRDAQRLTEEMIAKARSEIQTERDRLRREIETARDQALHELWKQAAQLATLISAKAVRRHLTEDDHRQLVDEALAELSGAVENGRRL